MRNLVTVKEEALQILEVAVDLPNEGPTDVWFNSEGVQELQSKHKLQVRLSGESGAVKNERLNKPAVDRQTVKKVGV